MPLLPLPSYCDVAQGRRYFVSSTFDMPLNGSLWHVNTILVSYTYFIHSEIKWLVISKLLELGGIDYGFSRDSLRGRRILPTRASDCSHPAFNEPSTQYSSPHNTDSEYSYAGGQGYIKSNLIKTEYITLIISNSTCDCSLPAWYWR